MNNPTKLCYLDRKESRQVDEIAIRDYQMTGLVLMENAGRSAAEWLAANAPLDRAVVLCGLGNNGGDGWVIARHLENLSPQPPSVYLAASADVDLSQKMSADAYANYRILLRAKYSIHRLERADDPSFVHALAHATTIIDALVGTGNQTALREPMNQIVEAANRSQAMRIAIDIPSGLDCDSGKALGPCFRADHTLTFVARKIGFAQPSAQEYIGQVHLLDIGLPKKIRTELATRMQH
jgi:NAD(P)H-hydrate epimerase